MRPSGIWQKLTSWRQGPSASAGFDIHAFMVTDRGCHREINEDSSCYILPKEPDARAGKGFLAIVADGMGGHAAGEQASRLAVETISRIYYSDPEPSQTTLNDGFRAASQHIYEASQAQACEGMGTTCTAVAISGTEAHCAHVGDSRLYLIRDGEIHQLTADHSKAMDFARRGLISMQEARTHEERNVIYRALGRAADVTVAAWCEPLELNARDRLVLSTDGLHDLVQDEEIRDLTLMFPPEPACRRLVDLAKDRGGVDNITVLIIFLKPLDDSEAPKPHRLEAAGATK